MIVRSMKIAEKKAITISKIIFFYLATGGSSWADDVADLPSARKFHLISNTEEGSGFVG